MRRTAWSPSPVCAQNELEALCNDAEQDESSEDALAEIDRLEAEIAALTEEVYPAEEIACAGAFVALGRDGEARIERGYLRVEDECRDNKAHGGGNSTKVANRAGGFRRRWWPN
jgi:ParB family transcriptional regulator, chromosome partitioning protein